MKASLNIIYVINRDLDQKKKNYKNSLPYEGTIINYLRKWVRNLKDMDSNPVCTTM